MSWLLLDILTVVIAVAMFAGPVMYLRRIRQYRAHERRHDQEQEGKE